MNFSSLIILAASVFAHQHQQQDEKTGMMMAKQLNKGSWPWGFKDSKKSDIAQAKSAHAGIPHAPIPTSGPLWNGQFPWMSGEYVCRPECNGTTLLPCPPL